MDKRIFVWDASNGFIVGSVVQQPEPTTIAKWGGFAKDIKGRDLAKYQFATAGNKSICLWRLDVKVGVFEHEMVNTGNMIREYVCMDFSKNREDFLILGTASGDFCVFQMKNKYLFYSKYLDSSHSMSLWRL
jgi:WD40 repeat protein